MPAITLPWPEEPAPRLRTDLRPRISATKGRTSMGHCARPVRRSTCWQTVRAVTSPRRPPVRPAAACRRATPPGCRCRRVGGWEALGRPARSYTRRWTEGAPTPREVWRDYERGCARPNPRPLLAPFAWMRRGLRGRERVDRPSLVDRLLGRPPAGALVTGRTLRAVAGSCRWRAIRRCVEAVPSAGIPPPEWCQPPAPEGATTPCRAWMRGRGYLLEAFGRPGRRRPAAWRSGPPAPAPPAVSLSRPCGVRGSGGGIGDTPPQPRPISQSRCRQTRRLRWAARADRRCSRPYSARHARRNGERPDQPPRRRCRRRPTGRPAERDPLAAIAAWSSMLESLNAGPR